ncbi:S-layer homology domain-containing protein [Bacillus ndiopicus]
MYIAVQGCKVIVFDNNGDFRPNKAVTRAQFVAFMYHIMRK